MEKKKDLQEAVEDLSLALIYLTRFPDCEKFHPHRFDEIAWKGYDYDALNSLDGKGLIVDPHSRGSRSKYAFLTEAGRRRAKELLMEMGIADQNLYERFLFRNIRQEEADEAADIEAVCFPPNEACSRAHMKERIRAASELFLVAADRTTGKLAGFLNGIATHETAFRDAFFTDSGLHTSDGETVMLLGLDVLPAYRRQGLGRELVWNYCRREQEKGRERLALTCHASKVKMYRRYGFRDLGESASAWGGQKWHEMDVILNF